MESSLEMHYPQIDTRFWKDLKFMLDLVFQFFIYLSLSIFAVNGKDDNK